MGQPGAERIRVVVVSGLSGAGKSGALKLLEDLGYEAVDNLPLSLLRRLIVSDGAEGDVPPQRAIAAGIDSRTRDFNAPALGQLIRDLKARPELDVQLIYFECDDDVLLKRFTATRRRHPLADDRGVADGIAAERAVMAPLRAVADHVFDTSALALPELRRLLQAYFSLAATPALNISVTSFSYRFGLPREADLVFDARFLRNPHYDEALRPRSGDDPEVGAYIAADPDFAPFMDRTTELVESLLPRFDAEGKRFLTIAIGCTGGRHRSVYVAEDLSRRLRSAGYPVSLRHRDRDLIPPDGNPH
jgi:UPF0042 nucleotide-binding protein